MNWASPEISHGGGPAVLTSSLTQSSTKGEVEGMTGASHLCVGRRPDRISALHSADASAKQSLEAFALQISRRLAAKRMGLFAGPLRAETLHLARLALVHLSFCTGWKKLDSGQASPHSRKHHCRWSAVLTTVLMSASKRERGMRGESRAKLGLKYAALRSAAASIV